MNSDREVHRLLELMPASGRMFTRLVNKPEQSLVIYTAFPSPWQQTRPISINFDLWQRLSQSERDLVLLRAVSWVCGVKWFQPNLYQAVAAAGLMGSGFELMQQDAVGVAVAVGLTWFAARRLWQRNRSLEREIEADEAAIRVAVRRGYNDTEAAQALLDAISHIAELEGRTSLSFVELIRVQNLRAIANLSPVGVPDLVKREF